LKEPLDAAEWKSQLTLILKQENAVAHPRTIAHNPSKEKANDSSN
jgi:hypothetical protein